ncbi:MAG: cytochrome [Solirubrobacterales bacterium]|nr:cytochrome [Solirubrobacterales bacterium]
MGIASDYDHFAPEFVTDPYAYWKSLREQDPVGRSDKYGGFNVISRYADVVEAAGDPERFSSTDGDGIPPLPMIGMIPIDVDPPQQKKFRDILNPALTVNQAAKHEDRIRALAISLIEPLVGQPRFDAAAAVAVPLSPRATLGFIGFPEEDWELMEKATNDVTRLRGGDLERVMEAGGEMMGSAIKLVEARRKEAERDDLISLMFSGEIDGRKLEDWECVQMIAVLLFGAVDTTASAIAGSLFYLATHPEAQAELRAAGTIPNLALEELVRWTSPIQALGRTVKRDTELSGCPLHAGDRVLLHWGAGNRDESVFEEPDVCRFDRKPNKHLGFGMGPHRCVGVHLGKLMLRVTLEEFLKRIPEFELAAPDEVEWVGGEARGIRKLELQLVG